MIKMEIKSSFKKLKDNYTRELEYIAERIVIPEIVGNIAAGTDITGKPYEPLAEATVKDKGHDKQLIGKERRLFSASSYYTEPNGKNSVSIYIKPIRRDVAKHLQVDGVKSKKYGRRFFNFFGTNKIMLLKVKNFLNKVEKARV